MTVDDSGLSLRAAIQRDFLFRRAVHEAVRAGVHITHAAVAVALDAYGDQGPCLCPDCDRERRAP